MQRRSTLTSFFTSARPAQRMLKRVVYAPLYAASIMAAALVACAAPDTFVGQATAPAEHTVIGQTTQLMIKFTAALSEAQVIHKLSDMSAQYDVDFTFIRPMSGDAFVIVLKGFSSGSQLSRLLNTIAKRPDVVYIEQDRMMQHFQQDSRTPVY